jgi:signal transduction histidine kinase
MLWGLRPARGERWGTVHLSAAHAVTFGPAMPDTGVARAQRALARAMLFFRLGGIGEILLSGGVDFGRYPHPVLSSGLIALVVVESGVLVGACLRTGAVRARWIIADVLFCTAGLFASAVLTAPRDYNTWANFMYPFTVITSVGIGMVFRRFWNAALVTSVQVAGYVVTAVLIHGDPVWVALPNGLTYYANMVVAWPVARYLLASGRETDRIRADAVRKAEELAVERERARHARILHDRVLQTLETLAGGEWVADGDFRAHIAGEAAWLRALVEGVDPTRDRDLLTALQRLVQRNARTGLRVELNGSQLRDARDLRAALSPELVDAVVDATQEALTNVAKHAGVDTAVVRAGLNAHDLTVSVLDQGRGFDPDQVCRGTGIERSIRTRIAEQGGCVRIDSTVGAGTYVEISVPTGTE